MQTILGSTGAIGKHLAISLKEYTDKIRLVSRNPVRIHDSDELIAADLTKENEVENAIMDSEIVYVTIGFSYHLPTWETYWPPFISNVINSCIKANAKLVFFDNIYMYDKSCMRNIKEDCRINPPSAKGKVRSKVAKLILDAVENKKLNAVIARCADFYGPGNISNSILSETVIKPLSNHKKATWLSSTQYKHSFTYTPDAAKATAILGNSPESYNQVWHLPTSDNPPTGEEWIKMSADLLGVKAGNMTPPPFMLKIMSYFMDPSLREIPEMLYQYQQDYIFNSDKFKSAFQFTPTSYEAGLKEVIEQDFR